MSVIYAGGKSNEASIAHVKHILHINLLTYSNRGTSRHITDVKQGKRMNTGVFKLLLFVQQRVFIISSKCLTKPL